MTIRKLKKIQREAGLGDVHLLWSDEHRFVIAHTDEERASGMDLEECPVHQFMVSLPHQWDRSNPRNGISVLDDTWGTNGPNIMLAKRIP